MCCPHHNTNAKATNRTQYLPSKNSLASSFFSPYFFYVQYSGVLFMIPRTVRILLSLLQLRNAEPRSPSSSTRRLDSALLLLLLAVLYSIYFPYRRRGLSCPFCGYAIAAVVCSAIISCRGAICLLCLVPRAFDLLHIVLNRLFAIESFSILSPIPPICLVFILFYILHNSA